MAPRSIVRRLVLLLTLAMAGLWLAGSGAAILSMRHELDEAFDSALQETAQRLLPLAVDDLFEHEEEDDDRPGGRTLAGIGIADHEELLTYQVLDRGGRILLRSHDAPAMPYGAPLQGGFAIVGPWRVYTEGTISDSLFIQVAEPLAHRHEALWESAINLLLPQGDLLVVAERMGKSGADAEAYAKEVVMADLDEPGEEDVFRKVRGDLDKTAAHVTDNEIRRQMAELLETARQQILESK